MNRVAIQVHFIAWNLTQEFMVPLSLSFAQLAQLLQASMQEAYGEAAPTEASQPLVLYDAKTNRICHEAQTLEDVGLMMGSLLYCC